MIDLLTSADAGLPRTSSGSGWIASSLLLLSLSSEAAARPGCEATAKTETVQVVTVAPDLAIAVQDGRRLRLAGIEAPRATATHADWPVRVSTALAGWLVGRDVSLEPLGVADRWGLVPARLAAAAPGAAADAPLLSVAESLLGAGLARAMPAVAAHACFPAFLTAEADARAGQLGVWSDPYYAVLTADDRSALAAHAGSTIVAEGRVASLGESGQRTYLNLGPKRGADLSLVVPKAARAALDKAGLVPADLVGRRLRVRGLVDLKYGPQIEILDPDQVEVLDPGPVAGRGDPR